ncbi:unnamed protein product [Meganyctiphanes norvegica]|uniref:Uncharacterized protein n=1 Tax=Meganyctiphanes norvegica TaxID=48144 RepID=A0AAV2RVT2_MEGNR
MRSAYPLLVDQNGWSVGSGARDPYSRDPSSRLRAVGVELSRGSNSLSHLHLDDLRHNTASYYRSDYDPHEIGFHVEDEPPSYLHEYPQPQSSAFHHPVRSKAAAAALEAGEEYRSKRKLREFSPPQTHYPSHNYYSQDYRGSGGGINRLVQGIELTSIRPELDSVRVDSRGHRERTVTPPRSSVTPPRSAVTPPRSTPPRGSPRSSSPRYTRRHEGIHTDETILTGPQHELRSNHRGLGASGLADSHRGSRGGSAAGESLRVAQVNTGFRLSTLPSQFSLCCSTPDYFYNEERLRQEPEPGLCACCDVKVSVCPCLPCCKNVLPEGHMNSVCVSFICIGIILFIVFAPLLHYLIPSK